MAARANQSISYAMPKNNLLFTDFFFANVQNENL
jgi:hypothetical protein